MGSTVRILPPEAKGPNDGMGCGSPVTMEQAAVPGGTVEIKCSHPVEGLFVVVIKEDDFGAILQLCEVRVWVVPRKQCSPGMPYLHS